MRKRASSSVAPNSTDRHCRSRSGIHLTEIETDVTGGDAHFPLLPAAEWQEASREAHVSEKGLHYNFVVYSRR